MKGEWINNPKYGEQFKVVNYKSLVPASVSGKYSTFWQILADFGNFFSHGFTHRIFNRFAHKRKTGTLYDLCLLENLPPPMINQSTESFPEDFHEYGF
jgi:hypothetical protein